MTVVVEARNLRQVYKIRRGLFREPAHLQAVGGVSFVIEAGKTLAVVGESGCGKSTLARMVALIEKPTEGTLVLDGTDAVDTPGADRRRLRQAVQLVFQNPYGSLNPRKKISAVLEDPLAINTTMNKAERAERSRAMLARVGLRPEHAARYPHMFSGGQRQRVAIARALMPGPRLLVLDEPVSALDVSIRAQVLNLLADLQQALGVAYVFISHDLGVVRHMADEVLVMYLGRAVEHGPRAAVFSAPSHPYTEALLSATPTVDAAARRQRIVLQGELPSPINPPTGCAFHTRCPIAQARCSAETPLLHPAMAGSGQAVACLLR